MKLFNLVALTAFASLSVFPAISAEAQIVWVGGVSSDVFDVANWDLSASAVTTIEPDVSIGDDVVIGPGPFANSPIIPDLPAQQRLQLDDGYTLTLDAATLGIAGNDGVGGAPGTANGPTVNIINGAAFDPFFVVNDVKVFIDGTSSATFGGGGNPINLSTVDLSPGATLAFLAETPADYLAEHLSKTTVNGAAAVSDVNILVASDGSAGSVITVVPEPSSLTLAVIAGLALVRRRR